ncbi:hypothetical protein FRC19_004959 [Serendipita sp. 401]|nr:hypothetical protein FRC19_004959 [Serendipita sp. 401]KAG9042605.1 hypothetical protein FS842_002124 [Serendipita sp. 407]
MKIAGLCGLKFPTYLGVDMVCHDLSPCPGLSSSAFYVAYYPTQFKVVRCFSMTTPMRASRSLFGLPDIIKSVPKFTSINRHYTSQFDLLLNPKTGLLHANWRRRGTFMGSYPLPITIRNQALLPLNSPKDTSTVCWKTNAL